MTGPIWLQIGLGILTLLGLGVSGYATYRTSTRAKQIESQAAPYGTLAERVGRLETQVGDLLASQHEDRMYIRILIAERPPGRPLPQPVPSWIPARPFRPYTPYTAPTPTSIIQPPRRGPIDNP